MTQPSTPTLTPVVGVPATITNLTLLRGQATFDGPYLGGPVGAGIGNIPFEWDTTSGGWKNSNTDGPLELPLARTDVPAAIKPQGWLYIDLTWVDEAGRRQSEQLRFRPAAGDDGQLDLTRDQDPEAYTTTASLLALTADAEQAAAAANAAAGRVDDAILGLEAERQAVADSLTDIAQTVDGALAGIAQSEGQLLVAAGRIPWAGGDHNTLPSGAGDYLITRGSEAGQVWTRATNGADPTRNDKLESVSPAVVLPLFNTAVKTAGRTYGMAYSKSAAENNAALVAAATEAQSNRQTLILTDLYNANPAVLSTIARRGNLRIELTRDGELVAPDGVGGSSLNVQGDLAGPYPLDSVSSGAASITVTGGAWAAGDWVLLGSDDVWDNAGYADLATSGVTYNGEYVQVAATADAGGGKTTLHLRGPVAYTYSINAIACKLLPVTGFALTGAGKIRNQSITGRPGSPLLFLALTLGTVVEGVEFFNGTAAAINAQGNVNAQYLGVNAHDMLSDSAINGYGYGLSLGGPETGARVRDLAGGFLRHLYTTSPSGTLAGIYPSNRGVPRGTVLTGMVAEGCTNNALDTHAQCDGLVATNIVIRGSYGGIGMRGRNITISDFSIMDGFGYAAVIDSAARNVSLNNGKVLRYRASPSARPSGWVTGGGDGVFVAHSPTYGGPQDVTLDGVESSGHARHGYSISAPDVTLRNCTSNDNAGAGVKTDASATGLNLINPVAQRNLYEGLQLAAMPGQLVNPAGVTGNYLVTGTLAARRDIKVPTGFLKVSQPPIDSLSGNPTLSRGTRTTVEGYGTTVPSGGGITQIRNPSSSFADRTYVTLAVTGTTPGDHLWHFDRALEPGVVYALNYIGYSTSGSWNACVVMLETGGKVVDVALPTVANTAVQTVMFTVPKSGSYRIAFCHTSTGTAGATMFAGALDVQAGQGAALINPSANPMLFKYTGTTSATVGTGLVVNHFQGRTPDRVRVFSQGNGYVYAPAADINATSFTVYGSAASLPFFAEVF